MHTVCESFTDQVILVHVGHHVYFQRMLCIGFPFNDAPKFTSPGDSNLVVIY